jgi:hypothetical protein
MSKFILYKDSSLNRPKNVSKSVFASSSYGQEFIYEPSIANPYTLYYFSSSADFLSDDCRKLRSLKNTINRYTGYDDIFSFENFYNVTSSLIAINSTYFGSGLQKGSVSLSIYVSGSLLDEATDAKENGVLSSSLSGKVGIVLYNEGFILLNNALSLSSDQTTFNGTVDYPRWTNFNANDANSGKIFCDLSYGHINETPTNIVFAIANKNTLNHSNNITYIKSGSYTEPLTGSNVFRENDKLEIKNIVKSPFVSGSANFEKETYITRIGLHDKDKKIIGYATLANPVRKTENREFIFKLKLDI